MERIVFPLPLRRVKVVVLELLGGLDRRIPAFPNGRSLFGHFRPNDDFDGLTNQRLEFRQRNSLRPQLFANANGMHGGGPFIPYHIGSRRRGKEPAQRSWGFRRPRDRRLESADLYVVERHGWPVPTPEAYPVALRFEPGRQPQSPSGEDVQYLDCCLQAIPDFVRRGADAKTYEVESNGKRVKMRLSWSTPRD